jgi:hypothetical protein
MHHLDASIRLSEGALDVAQSALYRLSVFLLARRIRVELQMDDIEGGFKLIPFYENNL